MKRAEQLRLPELPRSERLTSHEYAYNRLRHALMIGAIKPGRPVTIREIAAALDVSPTPVREALRRLSTEHALTVLGNRRIMVPEMTASRFEELVALRSALECHAGERAIAFIADNLIDELERLDGEIDRALERGERQSVVLLNQRFHAGIYRANPEQVCMPMIESIWLQLGPFLRIATRYVGDHYPVDRHVEIIAALRKRDRMALAAAIDSDIRDGVGRLGREALQKIIGTDRDTNAA